ncbi:MAG: gamma-glutamyltransferase [Alphaproteobacteria bacterium]
MTRTTNDPKGKAFQSWLVSRCRQGLRQSWLVLGLILAGCGSGDAPVGSLGAVRGFLGGVVTDEPRAALIARDILSSGGSAADAAVAAYFALAVTLPSSAGLGASGACLVHDRAQKRFEMLDFRPVPVRSGDAVMPSGPRAMFALHARYGRLRWEQILSPAENLARFGENVSRAFAQELQAAVDERIIADPMSARAFLRDGRQLLREGDTMYQLDLAGVLALIRIRGPGDFYTGHLAASIERATERGIGAEDLRSVEPRWQVPHKVALGNARIGFVEGTGGLAQARRLDDARSPSGGGGILSARAISDGSTGFVVYDRQGGAVACGLTLGRPFGTGRALPGLGFFLGVPPSDAARASADSVMMVVNENVNEFFLGAVGSGPGGAAAAALVAARILYGQGSVSDALGASRAGDPDRSRVNVAYCKNGLPVAPATCRAGADPRGYGRRRRRPLSIA